jgi:phosphopantetheinyl transferase (holo-ACP synthase)
MRKIRKIIRIEKIKRILKNDGEKITTKSGIANELAAQFAKTSSTENYPNNFKKKKAAAKVKITINMEENDPYNGPLTEEELENALHEWKGTSSGPDDIYYEFLKKNRHKRAVKIASDVPKS